MRDSDARRREAVHILIIRPPCFAYLHIASTSFLLTFCLFFVFLSSLFTAWLGNKSGCPQLGIWLSGSNGPRRWMDVMVCVGC